MRTLIVSDLHLGSLSRADLLRREELRAPLLRAAADADRVVLLGDVLELRHGPMRDALTVARPFFEDLGRALDGRQLVIVAGNHDHALVEGWLANRGEKTVPPPLGLEQLLEPERCSAALARIAKWVEPARTLVAYPGLWVRDDVYATHGHYLDCHLTVPTIERLTIGAMTRVLGRPAATFVRVEDYERTVAPLFAWRDAVAREANTGAALNGMATYSAWQALRGEGGAGHGPLALAHRMRRLAVRGAFPVAVAALNRAGLGPLRADVSTEELRRAGLLAMGEVSARLGLGQAYVVFGHTHRIGPLESDHQAEWRGRAGTKLVNAGSWTYSGLFLTGADGASPYWPGGCAVVEDEGHPRVLRLLQDRTRAQIAPAPGRERSAPRLRAKARASV